MKNKKPLIHKKKAKAWWEVTGLPSQKFGSVQEAAKASKRLLQYDVEKKQSKDN